MGVLTTWITHVATTRNTTTEQGRRISTGKERGKLVACMGSVKQGLTAFPWLRNGGNTTCVEKQWLTIKVFSAPGTVF